MLKFIWRACRWHLEIYHSFSILWNGENNCPIWMNNGLRTGLSHNQDGLPCYWQDLQRLKLMITHSLQCRLSWYISIFIPSAKILSKASPSIWSHHHHHTHKTSEIFSYIRICLETTSIPVYRLKHTFDLKKKQQIGNVGKQERTRTGGYSKSV